MQDGGPPMACSLLCGSQFGNSLHQRSSPMVLERGKSQIGAHETGGASIRQAEKPSLCSLPAHRPKQQPMVEEGSQVAQGSPSFYQFKQTYRSAANRDSNGGPSIFRKMDGSGKPSSPWRCPTLTHKKHNTPNCFGSKQKPKHKAPTPEAALENGKWPLQSWMSPPGVQAT